MFNKIYSVLFFSLITISGCSHHSKFAPKGNFLTPGSTNPLKGTVLSLFEKNFTLHPLSKDSFYLNDTDSICFDENGNMTYEMLRITKALDSERIYKYDENGVHGFSKLFDNDSLIGRLNTVSKKIAPNTIKSIFYRNSKPIKKVFYTYDKNSFITEQKEFLITEGKEMFNLHQKHINNPDGRIGSATFYDSSGKQTGIYFYIYGTHHGADTIKIAKNNITLVHSYRFDRHGNPLLFMIDGSIQERYGYEYDNLGNWIKRVIFKNGKQESYQTRRYYYR